MVKKLIRRPRDEHYVYFLLRENGEPFYVGVGKGDRWLEHERNVKRGAKPENEHKARIIRKMLANGWTEIPRIKLIESISRKEALACEICLIAAFGRWPSGPLVNKTDGGDDPPPQRKPKTPEHRAKIAIAHIGKKHSIEARARMSDSAKRRPKEDRERQASAIRGRKHSPEHRAKIATALVGKNVGKRHSAAQNQRHAALMRGRKHTAETRAKMSASRRGRPGKKASAETRAKLSASHRGHKLSAEHRAKISASLLAFRRIERANTGCE